MPANRQNTHPQFVKVRGSLLVLGLTLDGKGESNHTAFVYLVSLDIILSTDITDGVICCMQVYLQRQCYNRLSIQSTKSGYSLHNVCLCSFQDLLIFMNFPLLFIFKQN